ncbi:MAG: sigma-70 family RNA polymerase sigma factor [Mycobacteriales bacterium]
MTQVPGENPPPTDGDGPTTSGGDRLALEILYVRHGRRCYSLAHAITGDDDLARQVVQDVFAEAAHLPLPDVTADRVGVWLISRTHRLAVQALRQPGHRQRRRTTPQLLAALRSPPPARDLIPTQGRRTVGEAIHALPQPGLDALVLAYFGGYTQSEIATMTTTRLDAIRRITHAAVRSLRSREP